MVELVDTLALGASVARREGSSPFIRTKLKAPRQGCFKFWIGEDENRTAKPRFDYDESAQELAPST